jgi:hypothetical protein
LAPDSFQLVVQRDQRRIGAKVDLLAQPRQEMAPPGGEIADARRETRGMQADPQRVHGRHQQRRIDPLQQPGRSLVGADQVPVPVDRQGRVGLVPVDHEPDRRARRGKRRIVQRPLGKGGRETRRQQQQIALACGTRSCSQRCRIIARLGCARPVSTKLRWRGEMSASRARSSWLRRRCWRQLRSWSPIVSFAVMARP